MPIRTGRAYLDSLRDGRQLWIDGELVTDVTRDPRFAAAARTVAELYDMQHDPALQPRMTYASPDTGEPTWWKGSPGRRPCSGVQSARRRQAVAIAERSRLRAPPKVGFAGRFRLIEPPHRSGMWR